MKIQREEFQNDLEMVRAGLSAREFIEQSSSFVFQDGYVITFNDEISCRKKVDLNITGAVQAEALLAILSKMDDTELRVRENEAGELEFRGKRKAFGITKDAEVFLPIDKVEVPKKWHALPPEFSEAVELARHCVSLDETKFAMTCIHVHPDHIEACDNKQLMRVKLHTGVKEPVLIRGSSMAHITTLGMSEIAATESWIHFRNAAGLVFSCRKYIEPYPELDGLMKFKGHPITIPKGMAEASDRAAIFASDKTAGDPLVTISLKDGVIRLIGEGVRGWYKEVRKLAYDGPPLSFLIAPELLRHISEKYSDAFITEDKLKVKGGSWQYVTVLGKPGEVEKEEEPEEEAPEEEEAESEE